MVALQTAKYDPLIPCTLGISVGGQELEERGGEEVLCVSCKVKSYESVTHELHATTKEDC